MILFITKINRQTKISKSRNIFNITKHLYEKINLIPINAMRDDDGNVMRDDDGNIRLDDS